MGQGFVRPGEAVSVVAPDDKQASLRAGAAAHPASNQWQPASCRGEAVNAIIDAAFSRGRTVALTFFMILLMGGSAYLTIPKESEPDVAIPMMYVTVGHEGISPDDAERLLVRPMEKELQTIEGIKEMRRYGRRGLCLGNARIRCRLRCRPGASGRA